MPMLLADGLFPIAVVRRSTIFGAVAVLQGALVAELAVGGEPSACQCSLLHVVLGSSRMCITFVTERTACM